MSDPDELNERDRAAFDRLCEEKGYFDGDDGDSWKRSSLLELDLDGRRPSPDLEDPPVIPDRAADPALLAQYRAELHKLELQIEAAGYCVAELRNLECRHDHVRISETQATIQCLVCGGSVEIWWWARRLARDWGNLTHWVQSRREERDRLERQVATLKREVANLSAQVKRRGGDPKTIRRTR